MKSTVYLTGKPSAKTKKRIIDLLAPSRAEVVAKTSTSHKPSSRASSCSDLTMLEDGALADTASFLDYRGTFRDDENKTERATDDGQDESVFGESMLGGSSRESPYRGRDGDRDSKVTKRKFALAYIYIGFSLAHHRNTPWFLYVWYDMHSAVGRPSGDRCGCKTYNLAEINFLTLFKIASPLSATTTTKVLVSSCAYV